MVEGGDEDATRIDRGASAEATDAVKGPGRTAPPTGARGESLAVGQQVGRYTLLRRLGAGGMGEVFLGYDADLDRRVAIKVLLAGPAAADAATRLVREAQALARLSHPNVVQVHEVGQARDRVFVAMEYVAGVDLRRWLKGQGIVGRPATRPQVDAVVGMMIQAGRGLAAAHAAGLAHRDVKPDNIFVGDDGRVRIGDFGLARLGEGGAAAAAAGAAAEDGLVSSPSALDAPLTRPGAVAGTPAYMAPEQRLGTADARADLFSLAVTFWEAVMGERPFKGRGGGEVALQIASGSRRPPPAAHAAPGWLLRALERGLEADPGRRWPSVDVFLAELEGAPRRRRSRAAALGVSLALLGGVGGAAFDRQRREVACEAASQALAETWSKGQREALRAAFAGSGVLYADSAFERAAGWLDRYVERWSKVRGESCRAAEIQGGVEAAVADPIVACLEDRRAHFDALVDALRDGGGAMVARAVDAAAALPAIEVCADPLWVSRFAPVVDAGRRAESEALRRRLAAARAAQAAGRFEAAREAGSAALAEAEAIGEAPVIAEALVVVGAAEGRIGDGAAAAPTLERAFVTAASVGHDRAAVEAAIRLADRRLQPELGLPWCTVSEGLIARAEARPGPLALKRAQHCGDRLQELGRHAEVRATVEAALAAVGEGVGEAHPAMIGALRTLASAQASLRDYDGALATIDRVEAMTRALVGERHPDLVAVLSSRGQILLESGRAAEALMVQIGAFALQESILGPDHLETAISRMNLGILHRFTGDFAGARALLGDALARADRVLAADDPRRLQFLLNLAQIEVEAGAHADAAATFDRAQALAERLFPPDHPRVLRLHAKRGWAALQARDLAAAEAHLRRALPAMETIVGATHHDTVFALAHLGSVLHARGRDDEAEPLLERALAAMDSGRLAADQAWVKAELAQILVKRPGAGARARTLAREALATLRAAGPDWAAQVGEIDAWVAAHPSE